MKQAGNIKAGILVLLLCLTLAIGAVVAGSFFLNRWRPLQEKGKTVKHDKLNSQSVQEKEPEWNGSFTNFLVCGIDNTNSLTDVIMIVSFDNITKKISILQIPRDTYAGNNVPSHKYNAVYGHHEKDVSGMETLKAKVESDFGIKIGNYAAVTTKGLRSIVDAAGGVDLNVPINMNYDDRAQNLHIHLKKGLQHLNGSQAEQFVRYRKGWVEGDIGRLDAQKIFLAAFTQKLQGMNLWELATKMLPMISPPDFMTDMTAADMVKFGNSARGVNLRDATVYTMPGEPFKIGSSDLYSVHKKELLPILNFNFVPQGVTLSISDLKISQKADTEEEEARSSNFEDILIKNQK